MTARLRAPPSLQSPGASNGDPCLSRADVSGIGRILRITSGCPVVANTTMDLSLLSLCFWITSACVAEGKVGVVVVFFPPRGSWFGREQVGVFSRVWRSLFCEVLEGGNVLGDSFLGRIGDGGFVFSLVLLVGVRG